MNTQTQIDFGRVNRDKGIQKAEKSANDLYSNWSDHAYELLKWFVQRTHEPFQAEDFRADVKGLLPEPPTNRAFGGAFQRAAKAGLIKKVGHAAVNNATAHKCFAAVWQKV
jgi:hypothetical protein